MSTLRNVSLVLGGALIGASVTYLVTKNVFKERYARLADEEIQNVKETYKLLRKEPPYDNIETAKKAYSERLDELTYSSPAVEKDADIPGSVDGLNGIQVRNAFDDPVVPSKEDLDVTVDVRYPDIPYVIPIAEFMDDEPDYEKLTITYYHKDKILTDDANSVVENVESLVGEKNLLRFGEGSDSPDTVFIRNERLSTDFEVCMDDRTYLESIAAIDWENDTLARTRRDVERGGIDE